MTERLHFRFSLSCIGEGNGNPLQCSCLESPSDGGAWWAAIYGVAQSWTWLKQFSSSSSRISLNYHYRKTQTCNSLRNIDTFSSLNRSGEAVNSGWLCPTWSFRTPDSPHCAAQLSPDSWNHLHGWDELPQRKGQENLHEACLAPLDQKWKLHGIFPLYVPVMKT